MRLDDAKEIIQREKGTRFLVYPYSGDVFKDVRTCKFFEIRHTTIPFGVYSLIVAIDPSKREIIGHRVIRENR